jgi:ABC-type glycerol-3-phosphate transport system substrate-binding protein
MIRLSERATGNTAKENGKNMRVAGKIALLGLSLGLAGCGSGSSNLFSSSALDLFSTSSKASGDTQAEGASAPDIECPGVSVRTGAATLM